MIEFGEDILAEYVLGTLPADEVAAVDAAVAASEALRREVVALREVLAAVGTTLEPVAPPPTLRERLLERAAKTSRFERFSKRVSELIDVSLARAKALLAGIDDAASWVTGFAEGIDLYHLDGGPRVANAVVGFVRIRAGLSFPHHEHIGDEIVFVLQGESTDDDGSVARPGDEVFRPADSEHAFATSADAPDYIYLAVVQEGVRIGDELIGPDDPRF